MPRDVRITTTPVATQPVTTLHVAFYGIDAGDGRLQDLIDRIDRWSEDNLGIEEPPHSWATHRVPMADPSGATACVCGVAPFCPRNGHPGCLITAVTQAAGGQA